MLRANKEFVLLSAAVLCLAGGCCCSAGKYACNKQERLLRHVVLIEFNEETTEEQIKETEEMFCKVAGSIEDVADYEWGTDVSDGERTEGFTHCFVLTFVSEAGLDRYQKNAEHNELRTATRQYIKKMLAFDYWQQKD